MFDKYGLSVGMMMAYSTARKNWKTATLKYNQRRLAFVTHFGPFDPILYGSKSLGSKLHGISKNKKSNKRFFHPTKI